MRIVTTSAVALGAALLLGLAGTSPSFAKGHDHGFGLGLAGPDTAGKVDEGVTNRGGGDNQYGTREGGVRDQAQSGTRDNSDVAGGNSDGSGDGGGGRGGRGR